MNVHQSLTHSVTKVFGLPYIIQNNGYRTFLCNKNVSLLNIFTFCHSLSETVTGVTFFTLWFITQEYSFLQKKLSNTEYMS